MEEVSRTTLLQVTQEDIAKVQKFFGISDPITIQESLDAIEEWLKKQDHLIEAYQYINRGVLEYLFVLTKGSIELTKIRIDKLFTTRRILSELVLNKTYEEFDKCWDHFYFVPMPILNPNDQTRCVVGKMIRENYGEVSILKLLRYFCMINETRIFYDRMRGDRYVWDLQNTSVTFLRKVNPFSLKKLEILLTEAYSIKLKGVYFINPPPSIDKLLALIKSLLKVKILKRLHVIRSYDDLYKDIPKEILPEDFGGDAPSLSRLSNQWKHFLETEKSKKLIDDLNKLTSDESKRSCFKFNEEYLGMPGSFRQMTVD